MLDPDFIVEKLHALRPDGTRCEFVVRVGKPVEDPPPAGTYVCVVQCSGGPGDVEDQPSRACGEGPMQALHLGLWTVRLFLEGLEEDHGLRFVWPEGGEPFDWRRFWYDDMYGAGQGGSTGTPGNAPAPSDPSTGGAE